MDTEGNTQSEKLNSAGAEAPVAVDTAVPSAGLAEPSAGSTFRSGEELGDLLGELELARGDLSLAEWRVEDVQRALRDECEVSNGLSGAAWHALRALYQAGSAVEDLVAALDARIAARKEQLSARPSASEAEREGGAA